MILMADISLMDALKTREIGSGGERVSLSAKDRVKEGEQVQLNLPERFDVRFGDRIFHFIGESFWISGHFSHYDSKSGWLINWDYRGKGTFINGVLNGKMTDNYKYYKDDILVTVGYTIALLSGKVDSQGLLRVTEQVIAGGKEKQKMYHADTKTFKEWIDTSSNASPDGHVPINYTLQLPINQSQSSQVLIPDEPGEEPESLPTEEPVATLPKVELPADASAESPSTPATQESETTSHPKPYDVCKDPSFKDDKDFKEYCANRAYNAKLAAEEEAEEKAQEEADAKAEAEYQAKMAKWRKEEEEYNRKLKRELVAQTRAWRKASRAQDKAFNESIARDQAARRAAQAEIAKAHKIVDRFGGDIQSQILAHKKIDKLKSATDLSRAQKITQAVRKQFYDSRQTRLQGEVTVQKEKIKEWDRSIHRTETIRDTAVTVNKILAASATGTAVVGANALSFVHSTTVNAMAAGEKEGRSGVVISLAKDALDTVDPFKIGSEAIDQGARYYRYHYGHGVEVPKEMKLYDRKHRRIKRVKAGAVVYDEKGRQVTHATRKRLLQYHWFAQKARQDLASGDANKQIAAAMDSQAALEKGKEVFQKSGTLLQKIAKRWMK